MRKVATINGVVFLVLLAIPLVAEYATATPESVPGTGFSVLLYEPFDFAYILFALAIFGIANFVALGGKSKGVVFGGALAITFIWLVVSFLAVGQLHLSLGGKL